MSNRDLIRMTDDEVKEYLQGRHTMSFATIGADGWPHVVAMWYGFLGDEVAIWTFRKSQKVRNIERDNRVTCFIESGEHYAELRGLELKGRAIRVDDPDQAHEISESARIRYMGDDPVGVTTSAAQAPKRVAFRIQVESVVSWDHSKLGGKY